MLLKNGNLNREKVCSMLQRVELPVIVGNPFSPIGRGTTALNFLRAFKSAQWPLPIKDIYSHGHSKDPAIIKEIEANLSEGLSSSINIYHINVNEIEPALEALNNKLPDGAFNIIYPFWELSKMPTQWIEKLQLFNEVWAPSRFIMESMCDKILIPVYHMPLPVEIKLLSFLGRRYFNLPESSYIFLQFFDFRSYIDRKNPQALIDVFEEICKSRSSEDIRLVIKMHGGDNSSESTEKNKDFMRQIQESSSRDKIIIINKLLSDNENKNLIRCCDCFVSLHRSEGFGLGMAEAMYLGKPVIATGYSGNLDFMTKDNSCLVDHELISVEKDQYPFAEGQVWANPDKEQAAHYMHKLLDDRDFGRQLGRRASQFMRVKFSYLSLGLRYRERLEQILQEARSN